MKWYYYTKKRGFAISKKVIGYKTITEGFNVLGEVEIIEPFEG